MEGFFHFFSDISSRTTRQNKFQKLHFILTPNSLKIKSSRLTVFEIPACLCIHQRTVLYQYVLMCCIFNIRRAKYMWSMYLPSHIEDPQDTERHMCKSRKDQKKEISNTIYFRLEAPPQLVTALIQQLPLHHATHNLLNITQQPSALNCHLKNNCSEKGYFCK